MITIEIEDDEFGATDIRAFMSYATEKELVYLGEFIDQVDNKHEIIQAESGVL